MKTYGQLLIYHRLIIHRYRIEIVRGWLQNIMARLSKTQYKQTKVKLWSIRTVSKIPHRRLQAAKIKIHWTPTKRVKGLLIAVMTMMLSMKRSKTKTWLIQRVLLNQILASQHFSSSIILNKNQSLVNWKKTSTKVKALNPIL